MGLMALPALAGTTQGQDNGWVGQMQNLHNSAGMQKAMETGDVKAMQDLMNSDPAVKTQIGQDNLNKMNQFMSQFQGNIMSGSSAASSGSTMMNGIGGSNTGSTMMNF
ncbi:hypothetical protein [Desulfosporosinus acididurans]|uniref:hypothetical protein n=1 Tax=Desulfosporosinus acididurans TaxID=476652 RepID=UPI003D03F65A